MRRFIRRLERVSVVLNGVLVAGAGVLLVAMMVLACANVLLRSLGFPIKGTFELMGFFGSLVAAFALGKSQMKREHIAVDVVIQYFPTGVKKVLSGVGYLIGAVFFVLAAWQTARWATTLWRVNELSETLRIIYYPFVYGVSLGCLVIALVLVIDMLKLANGDGEVQP